MTKLELIEVLRNMATKNEEVVRNYGEADYRLVATTVASVLRQVVSMLESEEVFKMFYDLWVGKNERDSK